MDRYVIAAKGAPEAIADLCHFDEAQWRALSEQIRLLSGEGLRVLGVAKAHFKPTALPAAQHDFDFEFVGLVGLGDPVPESGYVVAIDRPTVLGRTDAAVRVATYGDGLGPMRALVAFWLGRAPAPGRLPVEVPGVRRGC